MSELIIHIGRYLLRILGVWLFCSMNCEYRNYKWGHKYIKAFDARTLFQLIFTIWQSRKDTYFLGAITYIGYWCSIISTIAIIGTAIISIWNVDLWYVFDATFTACVVLNLAGVLMQDFDSILNRIF